MPPPCSKPWKMPATMLLCKANTFQAKHQITKHFSDGLHFIAGRLGCRQWKTAITAKSPFRYRRHDLPACANRIEKVLNKDFINEAGVNFASEDAQITFDSSKTSPEAIAQIIEKTSYKAPTPMAPSPTSPRAPNWAGACGCSFSSISRFNQLCSDEQASRMDDAGHGAVTLAKRRCNCGWRGRLKARGPR